MNLSKRDILRLVCDFFSQIDKSGIKNLKQAARLTIMVDNSYETVARAAVDRSMKSDPLLTPLAATESAVTDCDDFALHLKSVLVSHRRQTNLTRNQNRPPPAVAIVITHDHAVNTFVGIDANQNTYLALADASLPSQPITRVPAEARSYLGMLPVRLIYI